MQSSKALQFSTTLSEVPAHSITLVAFDKIVKTLKALQANCIDLRSKTKKGRLK